jgi:hypothetical protein
MHVVIWRVSDNACSLPNEYLYKLIHPSGYVSDFSIRSATFEGAPNVFPITMMYSQTHHNCSRWSPVPFIRDSSYSNRLPECPCVV